jgi:hypothetical protein
MKLCKRIIAAVLMAALFAVCLPAFGAELPEYPEAPEGYDGYVTVGVSALIMGWGYILEPVLVPYHEGECVAEVTIRALDMNNIGSYYSTTEEGSFAGFYLMGVECAETEPNIPDYIMEQFEIYPDWATENLGYPYGEWTGENVDDGFLSANDYSTFSGWMYLDNDVSPWDGADALIVEEGHVYTWYFTVYGWGMDYGTNDGWGMFPEFDNPMMGVSRTEVSAFISLVNSDEELAALVEANAASEYEALLAAFVDSESSQDELDAALAAVLAALNGDAFEQGDVNMDGSVDSADALLIMRYTMSLVQLSDSAVALADMNGDNVVDLADALLILRASF